MTSRGNVFHVKGTTELESLAELIAEEVAEKINTTSSGGGGQQAAEEETEAGEELATFLLEGPPTVKNWEDEVPLVSWVELGQDVDLDDAASAIKETIESLYSDIDVDTSSVVVAENYVEADMYIYNFVDSSGHDYGIKTLVRLRVYKNGTILAWVPTVEKHGEPLLLKIDPSDNSKGYLITYYALKAFLEAYSAYADVGDISTILSKVKHSMPKYSDARVLVFMWMRACDWGCWDTIKGVGYYKIVSSADIIKASVLYAVQDVGGYCEKCCWYYYYEACTYMKINDDTVKIKTTHGNVDIVCQDRRSGNPSKYVVGELPSQYLKSGNTYKVEMHLIPHSGGCGVIVLTFIGKAS